MDSVRARGRRRPMAEINVVPYIDVMLVLLVIFMITAPMLNLGVEVPMLQSVPNGDDHVVGLEGFRQIVVCSNCQPNNLIGFLIFGGQHQYISI